MQSKYNFLSCVFFMFFVSVSGFCYADIDEEVLQEDIIVDQDFSADSVADYDVEGSVFQPLRDVVYFSGYYRKGLREIE